MCLLKISSSIKIHDCATYYFLNSSFTSLPPNRRRTGWTSRWRERGGSFGIDEMVGGLGDEEEEEAEEKWMNKGDVYFRGQSCSVHLKIGFVCMEREREIRRGEDGRR